ncbi:MAG: hypothetical protein AABW59_00700 [archaeon]
MNTIEVMEEDTGLEIKVEIEYTEFLSTKAPKWMKKDKEIMFAFKKLIEDSKKHEMLFREMEKKLLK